MAFFVIATSGITFGGARGLLIVLIFLELAVVLGPLSVFAIATSGIEYGGELCRLRPAARF